MEFVKKYWYILFGNFAFPILAFHTFWVCKKYNLPKWKVNVNFFFWGIVFMGIPTMVIQVLTENAENLFLRSLYVFCFYFTGIYATYRHARFREKHGVTRGNHE